MREARRCEGCGRELGPFDALWDVCMPCTRARHRAACTHRCQCGRLRRPRQCASGPGRYARRWLTCDRCFGTVAQLN